MAKTIVCGGWLVLLLFSLIDIARCQQLAFGGNVGMGLYQFASIESNDTSGVQSPLPAGQFRVECQLDGMTSSNISYSLLDDGDGTFRIDENSGALALQGGRRLDYETRRAYLMSAACTIPSSPTIPRGVTQINFNVQPINEFKPVILINSRPIGFVRLDEFSEVGHTIAIREINNVDVPSNAYGYTINDRDEGETEILTLFESSSFDSTLFRLEQTGTITLAKKLDLDDGTLPVVDLVDVRVCNSDPPTGISCGNLFFSVVLTWSNDNDPTFSQNTYAVTVSEDISPSSLIANVSCTDGDFVFGAFSGVTSSSDLFNVSVVSGLSYQLIYLTAPLDYEVAQSHSVILTCTDTLGKNATADLLVTIMPINDNPPRFSENSYIFQASRFLTLGSEIGRVQAIDNDMDEGSTLTFTLTNSTNFEIEPDGTVILRDFVYVIEGQTFQLQAVVSDGQFNNTARVTITMTGVVSIPEVILICMGTVIFIVLVIFIIVCCCYLSVCCSRLLPKQHIKTVSAEMMGDDNAMIIEPVMFPMQPMENMYQQGKGHAYMLGKVPTETEDHYDRSFGHTSDTDFDDPDHGSMHTVSSHMYTPTSYLTDMIEKFKEGDKILDGKKSKKSAS